MASNSSLVGYTEVRKVLDWLHRAPPTFDPAFVLSLQARLDKGMNLTEKQLIAIKNIIIKFKIDPIFSREPKKRQAPPFGSNTRYFKTTDVFSHYY